MTDQFPPNVHHEAQGGPDQAASHAPDPQPMQQPSGASAAPQRPAGYRRPDPVSIRKRRRQKLEGFEFVLHATTDDEGNPTVVRAKRPDLFDAESITSLPQVHQQAVFNLITETEKAEGKAKTADEREAVQRMSVSDLARNFGNVAYIADAYVILGFLEPRVYATVEEADAKGGLWIKDIESVDRLAFMQYVDSAQQGAAAQVATFPAGPDGTVDAGSIGTPVSGAGVAQPDRGPEGTGTP